MKGLDSLHFKNQPFVRANTGIVGAIGLYEGGHEHCDW